ncbi:related to tetracycline resistance protein from transposon Tn4351/Tn4400 [Phialocephala subalpina]|uniref:Related to tetracycline resistance protein from transposon Tn4351/Tn4400 n=1 Tax=Phialocephala subalpina TaxID=576137 RepID=A0A1L7X9H1_9HELO|nr:related to tetracycline resistance protein from transposon Tn4351/Tn4400 [Phialocephala subalpina]
MSTTPKIAIIGAGPAGLTLGAILQKNSVPFTIFDSDASPNERNQGGTLDLHPQGGQAALKEAGLWEEFTKFARPESDVLKVVKNDGEVLWDGNTIDKREVPEDEKFANRPEIDRSALKEILLTAVKPEAIQWDKHLAEAVAGEGGKYDLHFADGTVEKDFDLIVGADGAWSKIRKLLTDKLPEYSGISLIECWSYDVAKKNPWMSEYVGAGSCYSFGEGRTIQIQRLGDGSIRAYACLRKPESFLKECGIDWTDAESAKKQYVKEYFDDCGADLKRVILESNDHFVTRVLYQLPVGFTWESRPGVTLIGDAAHLMTPFGGVGVNAAMMDSLLLAQELIKFVQSGEGKLADVVKQYETDMFPRGEMFARKTMDGMKKHFSAGGSEHLAGRLLAHFPRKS